MDSAEEATLHRRPILTALVSGVAAWPTYSLAAGTLPAKIVELLSPEDLVVGRGPEAKVGLFVVIDYVGRVKETGQVFDDTEVRKKPRAFVLGGRPFSTICAGLLFGVEGMKAGGK